MPIAIPLAVPIGEALAAAGAAAFAWMTSATGVAVIGGAATGVTAGVIMNERAKAKAQEALKTDAATKPCANCPNPCAALACGATGAKYRGGAHSCMTGTPETLGDGLDSHHTPARINSPLPPAMGPAIQMDAADHRMTASYGRSPTDPYMLLQKRLIASGNFMGAVAMDVADVKAKFGSKYDGAIAQMMAYAGCLKANGLAP